MMRHAGNLVSRWAAVVLVSGLALPLWADEPGGAAKSAGTPVPTTAERVAQAIAQLGDPSYATREAAMRSLWEIGRPAIEAVQEARGSTDPEVAWRAEWLHERIRYGLRPDTDPELRNLIAQFRFGSLNERTKVIQQLVERGQGAYELALTLAMTEDDERLRGQLLSRVADAAAASLPAALARGQASQVVELLRDVAETGNTQAARNYVAYLAVRGELQPAVEQFLERARAGDDRAWPFVAYAYRVLDQPADALAAAERAKDVGLQEMILRDERDWPALVSLRKESPDQNGIEQLGFLAAYQLRAGDDEGFAKTIGEIEEVGKIEGQAWNAVQALLLNERVEPALKLLEQVGEPARQIELWVARQEYEKAEQRARTAIDKTDDAENKAQLRLLLARVLDEIGRFDEADKEIELAIEQFDEQPSIRLLAATLDTLDAFSSRGRKEIRAELVTLALSKAVEDGNGPVAIQVLVRMLFADAGQDGVQAWEVLRRTYPEASRDETLARLRLLTAPEPSAGSLTELQEAVFALPLHRDLLDEAAQPKDSVEEAQEELRDEEGDAAEVPRRNLAAFCGVLASAWQRLDRVDEAEAALRQQLSLAPSAAHQAELGDLLRETERWAEAVDAYRAVTDTAVDAATQRWLEGYCLLRAGDAEEGAARQQEARLLPLADERARFSLAEGLEEAGFAEAAQAELEMLRKTTEIGNWFQGEAYRRLARAAQDAGDYSRAAHATEQSMLRSLQTSTNYTQAASYLAVPAVVRRAKARAALQAGDVAAALAEANAIFGLLPGDIGTPLVLIAPLEELGRDAEADGLFERLYTRTKEICDRYPTSARHRNDAAWLAAKSHRELDEALQLATAAVELAPERYAYIDTLAEVHFHRGNREEAIRLAEQCVAGDPDEEHYQEQLARYRTQPIPTGAEIDE